MLLLLSIFYRFQGETSDPGCSKKKGMLIWNTNAQLNNCEFITSRRPNPKLNKKAEDYTTCPSCLGPFTKNNIRHHVAECMKQRMKGEHTIASGTAAEGRMDANASDRLRLVIFPVLRQDEIVKLIRYDWLLIIFGNRLCMKYTAHYQHNMIRARLRLVGRLLHTLRTMNPLVTDFASIYNPKLYDSMIDAVRAVGRQVQTYSKHQLLRRAQ